MNRFFAPLLWLLAMMPTTRGSDTLRGPNVIVLLADDMGVDSVSAMNPRLGLKTPGIDRLASEGMAFTDAHSTSAVCTPTRYSLLTRRGGVRRAIGLRESEGFPRCNCLI